MRRDKEEREEEEENRGGKDLEVRREEQFGHWSVTSTSSPAILRML